MLITAMALLTLGGCKGKSAGNEADSMPASATKVVFEGFKDGGTLALEPEEEPKAESKPAAKPAAAKVPAKAAVAAPKAVGQGKTETIYVESDCLNGRVWGHITMKGDRGSGTVHDEGENTLAVTATRHGNELHAVDQNGRQYVFRLRK